MIGLNEIKFDDKGTYTDFGLLLTGRKIGSATPKRKTIDVPWRDGVLDYTQVNGRTFYNNRTHEFSFKLINPDMFYVTYSELAEAIHGKTVRIVIPEDPSYYYYGMCEVGDMEVSKALGTITVTVNAEPYKYSFSGPNDEIRWDDVNFETTVFRHLGSISVSDSETVAIPKGGVSVVPIFNVTAITSASLKVRSNRENVNHDLSIGRNRFPSLTVCGETDVTLTLTGSGTLTIDYKESKL